MIDAVRGEVLHVAPDHAVIDVGGLGYRVHATPATLSALRRGEQAALTTTLVVREDSLTLYGFDAEPARELFTLTQTVSGVGPRLAMAILAVLEPAVLTQALADGDVKSLTRVPGIGKRTAERMVVELRDKVSATPSAAGTDGLEALAGPGGTGQGTHAGVREQVVDGLTGLGFAAAAAEKATDAVLAEADRHVTGGEREDGASGGAATTGSADADVPAVLRAALSRLGPAR